MASVEHGGEIVNQIPTTSTMHRRSSRKHPGIPAVSIHGNSGVNHGRQDPGEMPQPPEEGAKTRRTRKQKARGKARTNQRELHQRRNPSGASRCLQLRLPPFPQWNLQLRPVWTLQSSPCYRSSRSRTIPCPQRSSRWCRVSTSRRGEARHPQCTKPCRSMEKLAPTWTRSSWQDTSCTHPGRTFSTMHVRDGLRSRRSSRSRKWIFRHNCKLRWKA